MILSSFRAHQFRNIGDCELFFTPGVNLLIGENAQGKTNVLEGIYLFARGKSFRGGAERELTKFGTDGFSLGITFRDERREQALTYSFEGGSRRREKNGAPVRLGEMLGVFRAVLFYPEHLQIVKGAPEKRREFLNVAVAGVDTTYLGLYTKYAKILENRNALLKQASKGLPVDREELVAWSESLALAATDVYLRRRAYLLGFAPRAEEQMSAISDEKETLLLTLEADTDKETPEAVADDYRACFLSHLERECAAGCTLFGPHRDDIGILLSGLDARVYASQGQQRSIVLALKLAEGEYNREKTGDYPVFLLDDVLSELDASRRAYLIGAGGERQLIVTSCEETMCGAAENIIRVSGGNYVSAYR